MIRNVKSSGAKLAASLPSALILLPTFLVMLFLPFVLGYRTAVQTVTSVDRNYRADVVEVNEGALGGDTIVEVYEEAIIQQTEAYPLLIVMNPSQVIRKGERHPNVYLVQAILAVLSENYQSIGKPEFSGILDSTTSDALATFQELSGLPMTGNLDKHTWKQLALQYPLAANLQIG